MTSEEILHGEACIGGEWVEASSGRRFAVLDPATGEEIARVSDMAAPDVALAVDSAHGASGDWRARTAKERGALLRRWFDLLLLHQDALAELLTREQGKPLAEARGEVAYGAAFVEWFAEEAKRAYGDVIPSPSPSARIIVTREPVGVVATVTPWNFPVAMITRKVAPALAAGCTVVAKPAEDTPLCALALADLALRAGVPPGVFNVIPCARHGAAEVGEALCRDPRVRKISFTGSTATGKLLMAQAAQTVKRVSLELGGNAPFLVFDDARLDAAVEGCIASKFRNTGQTCVCANRILVQDGIHDAFAARLAERVGEMKVGAGFEEGSVLGPLINSSALEKVEAHVEDSLRKGASLVCGGRPHPSGGLFYEPTVLTGASSEMRIAEEETFGPVAALFRFRTEEEAVALANDSEVGLAAYLYSRDHARIWRVAEALEVGMVGVNSGVISTEVAPFGGVKQSGIGREGSRYGLDEYLEQKYVMLGGLDEPGATGA